MMCLFFIIMGNYDAGFHFILACAFTICYNADGEEFCILIDLHEERTVRAKELTASSIIIYPRNVFS